MITGRTESVALLVGDVVVLYLSLYLSLAFRALESPSLMVYSQHAEPFTLLFLVWVLVFFIAGLYEQHTTLFKERLPSLIIHTQIVNVSIAALFFFTVPVFGITPKTILLIYLGVSSLLLVLWRLYLMRIFGLKKQRRAIMLGSGPEAEELEREINSNPRYGFRFIHTFAPQDVEHSPTLQEELLTYIKERDIRAIVADIRDPHMEALLPVFFNILFLEPRLIFMDSSRLYEGIFSRIPVSSLSHRWFFEHVTKGRRPLYDVLRRLIDVVAGCTVLIAFLLTLPCVALAVRLDDGGTLFVRQVRVGHFGRPLTMYKYRTMSGSDEGSAVLKSTLTVTRIGRFLRKSRIDELPQALNLLSGSVSLIGPRPELPALVDLYSKEVPYYRTRLLLKPGLTGWAQLFHEAHPHHGADINETRRKLSYDLFYLKNRSLTLDIHIILKTLKVVLSRSGC